MPYGCYILIIRNHVIQRATILFCECNNLRGRGGGLGGIGRRRSNVEWVICHLLFYLLKYLVAILTIYFLCAYYFLEILIMLNAIIILIYFAFCSFTIFYSTTPLLRIVSVSDTFYFILIWYNVCKNG